MKSSNNSSQENGCNINVSVDVTKIVKYSCLSSVIIVLIIFSSKVIRELFTGEIGE